MKKRNKPIVLVTMLILMVGAVAFINFPKNLDVGGGHGPNDGHGHGQEEAPPTGKDVTVPDQASIAESVSSSIASKDTPRRMPTSPGGPGRPGGAPETMIKLPKASQYKPKPNDSSTATQWYTDESMKEIPKN
ncbi:MAG: hypothetical protein ACO1SV_13130 [Fimbriimonas sp.]